MVIMPRLTIAAGFEMGTGIYINVTSPEDAARYLREVDKPEDPEGGSNGMNEGYDQQAGEVVIWKRTLRRRARRRKNVYHSSAQKRRWVIAGILLALLAMGFVGYRVLAYRPFCYCLEWRAPCRRRYYQARRDDYRPIEAQICG